ncbi:unnamed protein product, partial [Ectocarpus fasciculatus]
QAHLLAAQVDRRSAGARLALLWLHRRGQRTQLAAWRQWARAMAEDRDAEEREAWRGRAAAQLGRELARAVEGRRRRLLRRSLRTWHRHAEGRLAHAVMVDREASAREAGARRLCAALERNLLRRQARVWGRLVGSAVAASGRQRREREAQERTDRLLAVAESRSSRRLLSRAWSAWKGLSAEQRRRGEVATVRAACGAAIVAAVARRKEEDARRRALSLWRQRSHRGRQREHVLSRAFSCVLRAEARVDRDRLVRYLARWRLAAVMGGRALADEDRAAAEAAFRGQTVLSILRRKRVHRLGEGFRRLVDNRTLSVLGSREEQARRDDVSRGLRGLKRTVARITRRRVAAAFARWQCHAAEVGRRSDRALVVSAQRRTGAKMLGSVVARREASARSRAWTLWRSGAASAAIHDGERASADLRVSGARHSAGARLLATAMGSARRRVLWKAWRVWCGEAKAAADAGLQTMEKHFHMARTLTRVERRVQLSWVRGAWQAWRRNARSVACFPRVAERSRRALLAQGMNRWRVANAERGQAEAERERAVAEEAVRARALWALLKRRDRRQLAEGFNRILCHGAWVIYLSREEEARADRLSRAFQCLARACARRGERRKSAALSRWRHTASESRREEERGLLQARSKRAAAKTLASLVSHRERSHLARAWVIWRSGAASAAIHEGERASADRRVLGARQSAGCRLLVGVLGSARRRALTKAWSVWCTEVKAAAEAELQSMEKNFHLARTLTRVERRTQLAKMGRAWRAWGEVVRTEGEAELQRFERHFHVAQTVARVVARVHQRRLLRAWSLWARLAARGRPARRGVSASLSSLPLLGAAAARGSQGGASRLARVSVAASPGAGGIVAAPSSAAVDATEQLRLQQARRSVAVMYEAGAGAVRGLLRRAEARRLSRSWRAWRNATTADATRQARAILGATRIEELFVEAQENHTVRVLRRSWEKWVEWSTEEGGRMEREAEAASWATAEAEAEAAAAAARLEEEAEAASWEKAEAEAAAATAAAVQAAGVTEEGPASAGGRANNLWSTGAAQHESTSPAGTPTTEGVKTPHGDSRRGQNSGWVAASASPPGSAVSALRRRLRGETSLELPPAAVVAETSRSPGDVIPPPGRLASATSPPLPRALAGGLETPAPLLPHERSGGARGDSTPPGSGQAWSDQLNYSSSPFSPSSQPPSAAGSAMPFTSFSLNGRAYPEEAAAPFVADGPGEDLRSDSLDLTASGESFGAPQSRSAGGTALPTTTAADATTAGVALASPVGSLAAYMSDSSPLLGESVLMLRGVGGGVDGGSEEAFSGAGGGGRVRELFSVEDSKYESVSAETPAIPAHHGDETSGATTGFAGVGNGSGVTRTTPTRSPLSAGSGGGGRSGKRGRTRFPKSPPYVGGSVGLLSLSQGSPPWDAEEEEGRMGGRVERRHESSPLYGRRHDGGGLEQDELVVGVGPLGALDDDAVSDGGADMYPSHDRSEQQHQEELGSEATVAPGFRAVDGHMTRAAEDFVDIMTSIFWRWAFQRWARVTRDAAFTKKANETRLKV